MDELPSLEQERRITRQHNEYLKRLQLADEMEPLEFLIRIEDLEKRLTDLIMALNSLGNL